MNGRLGDKFFLINMETADDITVDENGNIIRYIPNEDKAELRDVTSVEDLYPLRETVDKLLKDTSDFVQYMDGGQAGVEFFTKVKNHFDKCEKNGKTPYVDIPTFINILTCVSNVYVLCYGDKRFGLSQLECINEFRDERNGRRAI